MMYELCIACDHCDPSKTNDRQQVFCEKNPPYVDPFNGCDEFENKALDECFKNIGKSDKNIGKSELNANEIIKEFNSILRERCDDCPFKTCYDCEISVGRSALDLINRQQAEIERLQGKVDMYEEERKYHFEMSRQRIAEAIKECLGKIEQMDVSESDDYIMVKKYNFDNLVKKMVGDPQ